jgi:hypothetical protein
MLQSQKYATMLRAPLSILNVAQMSSVQLSSPTLTHTDACSFLVLNIFSTLYCRFDYDAANVKGIVLPQEGEDDIDPR